MENNMPERKNSMYKSPEMKDACYVYGGTTIWLWFDDVVLE